MMIGLVTVHLQIEGNERAYQSEWESSDRWVPCCAVLVATQWLALNMSSNWAIGERWKVEWHELFLSGRRRDMLPYAHLLPPFISKCEKWPLLVQGVDQHSQIHTEISLRQIVICAVTVGSSGGRKLGVISIAVIRKDMWVPNVCIDYKFSTVGLSRTIIIMLIMIFSCSIWLPFPSEYQPGLANSLYLCYVLLCHILHLNPRASVVWRRSRHDERLHQPQIYKDDLIPLFYRFILLLIHYVADQYNCLSYITDLHYPPQQLGLISHLKMLISDLIDYMTSPKGLLNYMVLQLCQWQ